MIHTPPFEPFDETTHRDRLRKLRSLSRTDYMDDGCVALYHCLLNKHVNGFDSTVEWSLKELERLYGLVDFVSSFLHRQVLKEPKFVPQEEPMKDEKTWLGSVFIPAKKNPKEMIKQKKTICLLCGETLINEKDATVLEGDILNHGLKHLKEKLDGI